MTKQLATGLLTTLLIGQSLLAQPPAQPPARNSYSIDDGWKYIPDGMAYAQDPKRNDIAGQEISLPHTWNATDVFDDDRTYKRSIGWYRKELHFGKETANRRIFLWFEGASQVADVYVNGFFLGRHKGGYTGFGFDITDALKHNTDGSSDGLVAVQVNNAHDPFVPPLSIGYASYGGIYRDAWVITTGAVHFTDVNNNSGGVYFHTPDIASGKGTIAIRSTVANETGQPAAVSFINEVYDAADKLIRTETTRSTIGAHQQAPVTATVDASDKPRLWSPADPYLYQIKSRIELNGRVVDEVNNKLGFRWFAFDPNKGFSLNGQNLVLHGTTRHQDMLGKGDALSPEDHERDLRMIKNMGANFIRLAHYPQAPRVLQLADELGLIIWEEVPVVNYMTLDDEFFRTAQTMTQEMIRQGYNHPSVVMWGSMNEILLYSKEGVRIQKHTDTAYIAALKHYAVRLDSTIRAEDPTRYSTMAMHLSDDYAKFGLDHISQVAGHNIYDGWYSGTLDDFGKDIDAIHRNEPWQNIFISEYGAEGEVRLNTEKPQRLDYTETYQRVYHEAYLRQINARPFLAGTSIWNEFDFSQPNIGGPQGHRNQKGMVTWDRQPKDVYYLYKANWNPEPMVYIASHDWTTRGGEAHAPSTIDIYSNLPQVSLTVNGVSQGTQTPDDIHKARWSVQLAAGENIIRATGKSGKNPITDELIINYRVYDATPGTAATFRPISVNVGSNAQYLDAAATVWIEDRAYTPGSFGHLGGNASLFARGEIIKSTADQPLYYSFLDSLQGYRFDVKDGRYAVTLYFAESKDLAPGDRVFDIAINGQPVEQGLDLAKTDGYAMAIKKTYIVEAKGGQGVQIAFTAKKGNTLLSGIKLEQ
ncbi:glycoside hydrolase family 2 TIM barrel-domain containing protein [Puia sp.]|jgi:beta-galactosidase|uniref:glycoside hydrolase family 2 TIM barrel-domain containing protein n=1 Tax=Puia sp. TaxID=2045100 RepID=UPI002F3EAEC8